MRGPDNRSRRFGRNRLISCVWWWFLVWMSLPITERFVLGSHRDEMGLWIENLAPATTVEHKQLQCDMFFCSSLCITTQARGLTSS